MIQYNIMLISVSTDSQSKLQRHVCILDIDSQMAFGQDLVKIMVGKDNDKKEGFEADQYGKVKKSLSSQPSLQAHWMHLVVSSTL